MNADAPYSLLAELEKVSGKGLPPIHLWHPENTKDIDMEIHADGSWSYLGTPITRPRLVHLFSTVLRKEQEDYFLVTPVEKCRVRVEDAPFVTILLNVTGDGESQVVTLTTNMNDEVVLGAEHPLLVANEDATALYVDVRDGLTARLSRNVYYELMSLAASAQVDGEEFMGIWSSGEFHPLLPASAFTTG